MQPFHQERKRPHLAHLFRRGLLLHHGFLHSTHMHLGSPVSQAPKPQSVFHITPRSSLHFSFAPPQGASGTRLTAESYHWIRPPCANPPPFHSPCWRPSPLLPRAATTPPNLVTALTRRAESFPTPTAAPARAAAWATTTSTEASAAAASATRLSAAAQPPAKAASP